MRYLNFAQLFGAAWLWRQGKKRPKHKVRLKSGGEPELRAFRFELNDGRKVGVRAPTKHKAKTVLMNALRIERGHGGRIEPFPIKRCVEVAA